MEAEASSTYLLRVGGRTWEGKRGTCDTEESPSIAES